MFERKNMEDLFKIFFFLYVIVYMVPYYFKF